MKFELPCEIVRDLLPGYADKISSRETNEAVENHIKTCEGCRRLKENMVSEVKGVKEESDEKQLFRKIKRKINRRMKITVACAVAAILMFAGVCELLFELPLRSLGAEDITVAAYRYGTDSAAKSGDKAEISADENDGSEAYGIVISELGGAEITFTEEALKKSGGVTAVQWSSKYCLREIATDEKDGVIYVKAIKTTILNNKAKDYQKTMVNIVMQDIRKIVYVEKNGNEKVLWEK